MRKIYLTTICTVFFAFAFTVSSAQVTYTTVQDGPMSDPATWDVNGVPPAAPTRCNNCTINIKNNVSLDYHLILDNTSTGSQITVYGGATFDIDNFLEFYNATMIVANNALVNVNDEFHLYGPSDIRLANSGSTMDANNNASNPSHGTIDPGNAGASGIYYILDAAAPPVTSASLFDAVLRADGYGGHFTPPLLPTPGAIFPAVYTFTCPSNCPPNGVVFGPAVSSLSGGVVQFTSALPLPITLSKFAASLQADKSVAILWSTSLEINSDYFSVERSADAANWSSLGTVKAKGHSSINVDYSYKDNSPINPTGYYRLKMVDIDGKFKYSKVVSVNFNEKAVPLVVYSNPFKDQIRLKINVQSAAKLDMTLTDMLGRTFTHQSLNAQAGDNFVNITPTGITEGLYILNIHGQNYHQTVKLAKQ